VSGLQRTPASSSRRRTAPRTRVCPSRRGRRGSTGDAGVGPGQATLAALLTAERHHRPRSTTSRPRAGRGRRAGRHRCRRGLKGRLAPEPLVTPVEMTSASYGSATSSRRLARRRRSGWAGRPGQPAVDGSDRSRRDRSNEIQLCAPVVRPADSASRVPGHSQRGFDRDPDDFDVLAPAQPDRGEHTAVAEAATTTRLRLTPSPRDGNVTRSSLYRGAVLGGLRVAVPDCVVDLHPASPSSLRCWHVAGPALASIRRSSPSATSRRSLGHVGKPFSSTTSAPRPRTTDGRCTRRWGSCGHRHRVERVGAGHPNGITESGGHADDRRGRPSRWS